MACFRCVRVLPRLRFRAFWFSFCETVRGLQLVGVEAVLTTPGPLGGGRAGIHRHPHVQTSPEVLSDVSSKGPVERKSKRGWYPWGLLFRWILAPEWWRGR